MSHYAYSSKRYRHAGNYTSDFARLHDRRQLDSDFNGRIRKLRIVDSVVSDPGLRTLGPYSRLKVKVDPFALAATLAPKVPGVVSSAVSNAAKNLAQSVLTSSAAQVAGSLGFNARTKQLQDKVQMDNHISAVMQHAIAARSNPPLPPSAYPSKVVRDPTAFRLVGRRRRRRFPLFRFAFRRKRIPRVFF